MSGNGVDLGAIYQAILAVAADARAFRAEVKAEFASVRAEIANVRTDLRAEIASVRTDLRAEIDDLRQAVNAYHGSVVGHGVLISELDERVSRLERREPPEAA